MHRRSSLSLLPVLVLFWMLAGPGGALAESGSAIARNWWSLRPVVRPEVPQGSEANPVDRFLNAEIRRRGLEPAPVADPLVLLRRVHLDLTGIPPTPEEQKAFLADDSDDAYERVVDRLLADEQHAVRYARHWLDVLRYADADERMIAAPGIHLWRDWVIGALRDDVPYDEFVQVQLTGRRRNERTQMSATGYRSPREPRPGDQFALGLLARGAGADPQDLAISAVDTVSAAFMGMTVACAKCHDHMYDAISQRDYYAMKALFDPLVLRKVTLASAEDLLANGRAVSERSRRRAPFQRALDEFVAPYRAKLHEERVAMLPVEVQAVIRLPEAQRTVEQQKVADDYFPILRIDGDKLTEAMPAEARERYRQLQRELNEADAAATAARPPPLPVHFAVEVDRLREREKSYVLTSGDPERPERDHEVKPGWPFGPSEPDLRSGRVEAFSDWLTAPENPLFARVAVNRLWQWHFGTGLMRNASDFGQFGGRPSHPELLEWLASEFVSRGFSMRQMHRLMVTSQAYRRATTEVGNAERNDRVDPENAALRHFPLRRLEAEPIWDSIHAAAGDLDLTVGGTSFAPGKRVAERVRRGAYLIRGYSASRNVTPDFLEAFDVDDGRAPCPLRTQTVTAPQALFLMNSEDVNHASERLAARLGAEAKNGLAAAVDLGFRLVVSRPATPGEMQDALAYLENDAARLRPLAWLLFNLDEFLYVR